MSKNAFSMLRFQHGHVPGRAMLAWLSAPRLTRAPAWQFALALKTGMPQNRFATRDEAARPGASQ
jgi:hypothetical protein